MKELAEKLFERNNVFFLLAGVVLLLIAASGEVNIATVSLRISDPAWQIVIAVVGVSLIVIGALLTWKDNNDVATSPSGGNATAGQPSKSMQVEKAEIDFLTAYLAYIRPDVALSDTYSEMVSRQFDQLSAAVKRLNTIQDWQTLLAVKQRLREYFEYTGKYLSGVDFGRMYVNALEGTGQIEEAIWTRVKHVGYLLLLAEQHELARREIEGALAQLLRLPSAMSDSTSECFFYIYRYLGISYQRDTVSGNIEMAKEYFRKAEDSVSMASHNSHKQKELRARLLGNWGNITLAERRFVDALEMYRESHDLFVEVRDQEHIGIAKLRIAQTLIASAQGIDVAPSLLDAAQLIFLEIGWVEGEARVEEQYARYCECLAREPSPGKGEYVRQALAYANKSQTMFRRIGLDRAVGRVEELKSRLSLSQADQEHADIGKQAGSM